jgi:hypothetical protein
MQAKASVLNQGPHPVESHLNLVIELQLNVHAVMARQQDGLIPMGLGYIIGPQVSLCSVTGLALST